jgi:hypothetical protein
MNNLTLPVNYTGMVEAMSTMPKVLSEITLIEEGLKSVEMEMSGLGGYS